MSRRREDIENAIWDDEDFDALSNDAALFYLWSFTNPRCGMAGVYKCKRRHLCEGRLTERKLTNVLAELAESRHVYYVDGVLWVRTRVKHLRTKGEPMQKSILKDLNGLEIDHPIRLAFITEYRNSWMGQAVRELEGPDGVEGGSEGVHLNGSSKPSSGTPLEPYEGVQGCG